MTINYATQVQPLEATLNDEQIAAKLSADFGRFQPQNLTPSMLAIALAKNGHADPAGVLDRMLPSLKAVGQAKPSVDVIGGPFASNTGTLDFANPLVRGTIAAVAAEGSTTFAVADAEAIFDAVPVPDAYTAADVADSRRIHLVDVLITSTIQTMQESRDAGGDVAAVKAAVDAAWGE